ncbi:hydroxymyristoyl-ACP dehydratase [Enterobacterales bacterium]|nr:hydroxymyristoyl-ACP dehydratase [Enterobacterales bacterium]
MKMPQIVSQKIAGDNVLELTLRLSPELFWFDGHFPHYPILPGVTQVHWVMTFTSMFLVPDLVFSGMDVVKFQRPLLPGDELLLNIEWLKEKSRLQFQYSLAGTPASSGKITLCR